VKLEGEFANGINLKLTIKQWIDDIGAHVPAPEVMLRQLIALTPATKCHIDGYYLLGTDHVVTVVGILSPTNKRSGCGRRL
jgi:hypothetical protein